MFPPEFIKRLSGQSYIDNDLLIKSLLNPAPVSVRLNPGKWKASEIPYEHVPWEPLGFYLPSRPQYTFDPFFHAGVYYPQEASGMFTGEVFRQVTAGLSDIRVLDLCGAPGSKSTHLSSLIGDNGFLVSNEVIRSRAAILAESITKWGLGNTMVTQNDPADFVSLKDFFDVIIVDAPCSGEGMFNDRAALDEWSPGNARLCSERQRRILMDVWPALIPGGFLIYSTCTFNPAENEENVHWLSNETGAEPVNVDISSFSGVSEIEYEGMTGYGLHPGKIKGDGFFISVLRKSGKPVKTSFRFSNREPRLQNKSVSQIADIFTYDEERIITAEKKVFFTAMRRDIMRFISERLTVVKAGTMIGEFKNEDFVPAHDLAMSVRQKRGAWPEYHSSYDEAIAFLSHDELVLKQGSAGRTLFCYRDVPLGFVNNLGRRVNNAYPQQWRIRTRKKDIFEPVF